MKKLVESVSIISPQNKRQIIAFHGLWNRPGRKDVTHAFEPECIGLLDTKGSGLDCKFSIDNKQTYARRKKEVLKCLKIASQWATPFNAVAFFCHGWRNGMEFGFRRNDTPILAKHIVAACKDRNVLVYLYTCSTAKGPDHGAISFADSLRDELCKHGSTRCRVMAHTRPGHTTRNPHAMFFDGYGSPIGGTGGVPVVGRKSVIWKKWRIKLRDDPTFRFRFPSMSIGAIHQELLGK